MPNPLAVQYTHNFTISLIVTMTLECLTIFLLYKHFFKYKMQDIKVILTTFFASFFTLPYVWFVFPTLFMWTRNTSLYYSEFFIFAIESIFYKYILKFSWKHAILASLLANLVSFYLPMLMRYFGIWFTY
jgi:hypothetical protein